MFCELLPLKHQNLSAEQAGTKYHKELSLFFLPPLGEGRGGASF
jgi:hypothetical protein